MVGSSDRSLQRGGGSLKCLLVVQLLISASPVQAAVSPTCLADLAKLCTDPSFDLFTKYVLTAQPGPYDFDSPDGILEKSKAAGMSAVSGPLALYTQPSGTGAWDLCMVMDRHLENLGIETPTLPTRSCMVPFLSMGFCLPASCSPRAWGASDAALLLARLKRWGSDDDDGPLSSNSTLAERTLANSLRGSLARVFVLPNNFVQCSGQTESVPFGKDGVATDEWNAPRILMALLCCMLGVLVLSGTAIEHNYHHRWGGGGGGGGEGHRDMARRLKQRASSDDDGDDIPLPAIASIIADFSLSSNFNAIFGTVRQGCFQVFDGMRTFSAMWIVFGHFSVITFVQGPAFRLNPVQTSEYMGNLASMAVRSMDISVDTFFVLSAFLATFFMIRKRRADERGRGGDAGRPRKGALRFVAEQYLGRYLRLTPLTLFCLLFFWAFFPMIGAVGEPGPYSQFWTQVPFLAPCAKYWWTGAAHVMNLVGQEPREGDYPGSNNCFGHAWYISCEYQLFLLVPLLVLVHERSRGAGALAATALMLASLAVALATAFRQEWGSDFVEEAASAEDAGVLYYAEPWLRQALVLFAGPVGSNYYAVPWMRAQSYLIGVLAAMLWTAKQDGCKAVEAGFDRAARYSTTLLLLALLGFGGVCYGPFNESEWSTAGRQVWVVCRRPVWGLAAVLFSLLCFERRGSLPGRFVSSTFWVPISTLSFALYLVHFPIVILFASSFDHLRFNIYQFSIMYLGVLLCSIMVAVVVHLLVEKPAVRLSKRLMALVGGAACGGGGSDFDAQELSFERSPEVKLLVGPRV